MILELLFLTLLPLVWGVSIFVRIAVGDPPARGAPVRSWRLRAFAATVRQRRVGIICGSVAVIGAPFCFYALARWTGEWDALMGRAEMLGVWWAASAAALVAISLATLIVGVWRDPSRGRRRCASCWYDFAVADVATPCPECGRVHRSERELRRTRRSWRVVCGAAVLFAASYFALVGQRIVKCGAIGVVPSTLMIPLFEHLPESWISRYNGRGGELADRALENELWGWQRDWLTARTGERMKRATTVRMLALCAELVPTGEEFPYAFPQTIEPLLDDVLAHALDANSRTQSAIMLAVMLCGESKSFDWAGWFARNEAKIDAALRGRSPSEGVCALVVNLAPTDWKWFLRVSALSNLGVGASRREPLVAFFERAPDLGLWTIDAYRSVPSDRRASFVAEFCAALVERWNFVDPVGTERFLLSVRWDSDPAIRTMVWKALAERLDRPEIQRVFLQDVVLRLDASRGDLVKAAATTWWAVDYAQWLLVDLSSTDESVRSAAALTLERVRHATWWAGTLKGTLTRPDIPPAHEAAIRAELARVLAEERRP